MLFACLYNNMVLGSTSILVAQRENIFFHDKIFMYYIKQKVECYT